MGNIEAGRLLALDVGDRRIGIAVSDPTGSFAVGLDTVIVTRKGDPIGEIVQACQAYQVQRIIIGLPVRMDGTDSHQTEKVRQFAQGLGERVAIPLEFFDERLTSVLAHQTLKAQGYAPSRHKEWVDQAAAKRILQDYMDREGYKKDQG